MEYESFLTEARFTNLIEQHLNPLPRVTHAYELNLKIRRNSILIINIRKVALLLLIRDNYHVSQLQSSK